MVFFLVVNKPIPNKPKAKIVPGSGARLILKKFILKARFGSELLITILDIFAISLFRLTCKRIGYKFGDRLWC
jgi:hypothetical protein